MPIYVTKSFMPPIKEYEKYIKSIYSSGILTNQGPLSIELENKLSSYLEVKNFQYVTNGTIALQLALAALDIDGGEVITTPFSYVATTTSILWERCTPVFVDIEPDNFTIDVTKIEAAITPKTRAIMPVHVFGYACDVEKIQQIADKHNLKVIYDGAHAFASKFKGKSLLSYGDITTCSFHATKLFHTIEGGACIIKDKDISDKLELQKKFGHFYDDYKCVGINGKQSEFNAAMGLANYPYISKIITERKRVSNLYDKELSILVQRPKQQSDLEYNYAYYPVVFRSEADLLKVFDELKKQDIYARRYFWPSLNTLTYLKDKFDCPISEDIASRIACLPLYPDLTNDEALKICMIIKESL
ncbi:DegT/DnrJ/EryC1/StrS family aminotransferase [Campylobacter sp. P0109]|uniref:DegT/DnrJ/EryC1/StrS family aminotransferase n=1 Tax=Campylobacter sp. P0109 TaxID=1895606 RepID=UPI000A33B2A2|nr:DegT/DnrJ/EryC1/StrS family aminotransferase [Campylobacter sp. P0109]